MTAVPLSTFRILLFLAVCMLLGLPKLGHAVQEHVATDTVDRVILDNQFSLREAMNLSNQDNDDSIITLSPGLTYQLTECGQVDDDTNEAGDLDHFEENDLTIRGDATNIQQNCAGQNVLHDLVSSGTLRLEGVNLLQGDLGLAAARDTELINVAALANRIGALLRGTESSRINVTITDSDFNLNDSMGLNLADANVTMLRGGLQRNGIGMDMFNSVFEATSVGIRANESDGLRVGLVGVDSTVRLVDSDVSGNGQIGVFAPVGVFSLELLRTDVNENGGAGVECRACWFINIQDSEINDNGAAGGIGGGIRVIDVGGDFELHIINSSIERNRTTESGGGLLVDIDAEDAPGKGPVLISGSFFRDNVSGEMENGGAMAVTHATTEIVASVFSGNRASDDEVSGGNGGAIHYLGPGVLTVVDSGFTSNIADDGSGGAISIDSGTLRYNSGVVLDNVAGGGGGIHGTGSIVSVSGVLLAGNRSTSASGGGISLASTLGSAASFELIRSTVASNFSPVAGGIWLNNTPARLENATVFLNVSGTSSAVTGRGIQAEGMSPIRVNFSSIVLNDGPPGSSQIFSGESITIENSVVDGDAPACASLLGSTTGGFNVVRDGSCPVNLAIGDLIAPSGLNLLDYTDDLPPVLVPNGASPLVGRVPVAACNVATDARGVIRPQGTGCDTGAAEFIGGGVAGLPPAFFIGFDQPGTPVDAAVARLEELGFEVIPADPSEPIGLAEILTRARLIILPPGANLGLLADSISAIPAAVVTWGADSYAALGLTRKSWTTHRPAVKIGSERVNIVSSPAELAVCDPAPGEGEIQVEFASSKRGALCVYRFGDMLANGHTALGRRVGVALDPEVATDAGWSLFDKALQEAVQSPEQAN
jgi:hypothetical protein